VFLPESHQVVIGGIELTARSAYLSEIEEAQFRSDLIDCLSSPLIYFFIELQPNQETAVSC
jgi:hypothetical protein